MSNATLRDINGDILHAFSFAQKTKPTQAIDEIFHVLKPAGREFTLPAGESYQLSPDWEHAGIILIEQGICSVCHTGSNLLISSVFAPTVLGLIDGYSLFYDVPARPQHYLYAETHCSGYFVPLDEFVSLADRHDMWHNVARILAHRLMLMSAREQELVGVDSYLKVRALLIELYFYPEEYRRQIQVMGFIQRRTNLSRSRIMAILSELRKGDYITIDSGKLISIQQKLPTAF